MRSAKFSMRLTALLMLLLLSSCDKLRFWEDQEAPVMTASPLERQVLEVRKRATVIQSEIGRLDRRNVPTFTYGDTQLDLSLYSRVGQVQLIDERLRYSDGSTERNRYYFDDGSFFHYYGQAKKRVNPGEDPPMIADIRMRMYFNDKGNLFHSEKTIDGMQAEMNDAELPNTMRRAFALRELEWTDGGGVVDTAAFTDLLYTAIRLPDGSDMPSSVEDDMTADDPAAMEEGYVEEEPSMENAPPPAREESTAAENVRTESRTTAARQNTREQTTQTRKTTPKTPPPPPQREDTPPPMPPPAVVPADEILIEPHSHAMLPGTLSSHRIRFQKGNTGATLSASVRKGQHKEYVLRAKRGQKMSVSLQSNDANVVFRVFLNDGDISGQRRAWSGSLPRYDDYHVVVYRKRDAPGDAAAAYTISMSIR
jgi:hypothetical protein